MAGEEKIPHNLRCPICWEIVYKPSVFLCGHFTCQRCIKPFLHLSKHYQCPLCRFEITYFPHHCMMLSSVAEMLCPKSYNIRAQKEEQRELEQAAKERVDDLDAFRKVLTCCVCKNTLVQPVVNKCGHVSCKGCIDNKDDTYFCVVCYMPCHNWQPAVCLALNKLVSEFFPRENINIIKKEDKQADISSKRPAPWWSGITLVHNKMCYLCEMCHILGDRFTCRDCENLVLPFHYCEECYFVFDKDPRGNPVIPGHEDHKFYVHPHPSVRDKILTTAATKPEDHMQPRRKSKVCVFDDNAYVFTFEGLTLDPTLNKELVTCRLLKDD